MIDYNQYITRDPKVCGGEAVVRGTRVTLRTVLASLAEGASTEEILADFPSLSTDSVRAVTVFAAECAQDRLNEDEEDLREIEARKGDPMIPFEEVLDELRRSGRLAEE